MCAHGNLYCSAFVDYKYWVALPGTLNTFRAVCLTLKQLEKIQPILRPHLDGLGDQIKLAAVSCVSTPSMPKKKQPKRARFYNVTEHPHSDPLTEMALLCDCRDFRQTGKRCEHTIAAGLYRDFGDPSVWEGKSGICYVIPVLMFLQSSKRFAMNGAQRAREYRAHHARRRRKGAN